MDTFERLAQQIDDLGDILCVPGVAEAIEKAGKEKSAVRQRGMILHCAALCARKAPDVVCRILADEGGKTADEVRQLPEGELTAGIMRIMNTMIVPFVASASRQETKP